jgi:hypothetical protein
MAEHFHESEKAGESKDQPPSQKNAFAEEMNVELAAQKTGAKGPSRECVSMAWWRALRSMDDDKPYDPYWDPISEKCHKNPAHREPNILLPKWSL